MATISATGLATGAGDYPEAASWSPQGPGAPLDAEIVITWTMAMDAASVEGAFGMTDGTTVWDGTSFDWFHAQNPSSFSRATPKFPLQPLQGYGVAVAPTAMDVTQTYQLDQNGNGQGGEPDDSLSWTFTTEDADHPTVLATIPPDGLAGVPVATDIAVGFSERMNAASVLAAFSIDPATSGAFQWNPTETWLTFDPDLNLAFGTAYTVRLDGSIARDVSGSLLDGDGDGFGGDDHVFSFTTEIDIEPPGVLMLAPPPGMMDVSVTARLEILFTETMNRSSVENSLTYSDGSQTWNRTAGAFSWAGLVFADDRAVFNPRTNFPFSRTITITLDASIARDLAGFGLDGNGNGAAEGSPADDVVWAFSTEPTDTTAPVVDAVEPEDGATGVSPSTSIRFTFSEMMDRASVEGAFSLDDGMRTWTSADGSLAWTVGDEEASFTPSATLAFSRTYTVRLQATAADVNGNGLDGNGDGVPGDGFSSTFRTRAQPDATPPHVVNTIPQDGARDVARMPVVSITFDDAMNRTATEEAIALANVTSGSVLSIALRDFEWSAADHTVSFLPAMDLEWDTPYRVTVTQAAKDDANLPLERPYTFSFRTSPWKGTVIGRVVDGADPIVGATVTLDGRTTQTSETGSFAIANVEAGTYNLTISKPDYETLRVVVDVARADADPETGKVDLGTYALRRPETVGAVLVLGSLLAALAAVIFFGLWRRRRGPPVQRFDVMDSEFADAER